MGITDTVKKFVKGLVETLKEGGSAASDRRTDRHAARIEARRNTRGLPVGVGLRQFEAAHAKRVSYPTRTVRVGSDDVEVPISRTRQQEIVNTLDRLERNGTARAKLRRPSKIARRVAALR